MEQGENKKEKNTAIRNYMKRAHMIVFTTAAQNRLLDIFYCSIFQEIEDSINQSQEHIQNTFPANQHYVEENNLSVNP